MTTTKKVFYWIARLLAAAILLQTLFFKFTGSPESVYIFTKVGMEPWGRIGSGVVELIASVLLLISATAWVGAAIAAGVMAGAIAMHLTILGIDVQNDHGQLFIYAWLVLLSCLYVLWVNREQIAALIRKLTR